MTACLQDPHPCIPASRMVLGHNIANTERLRSGGKLNNAAVEAKLGTKVLSDRNNQKILDVQGQNTSVIIPGSITQLIGLNSARVLEKPWESWG